MISSLGFLFAESLLALKKEELLKQVESQPNIISSIGDDEYAAFQAALAEDVTTPSPATSSENTGASSDNNLEDIIGMLKHNLQGSDMAMYLCTLLVRA